MEKQERSSRDQDKTPELNMVSCLRCNREWHSWEIGWHNSGSCDQRGLELTKAQTRSDFPSKS